MAEPGRVSALPLDEEGIKVRSSVVEAGDRPKSQVWNLTIFEVRPFPLAL
jgi:hypothetical protein